MTAYEQLLKVYSNPSPLEGSEAETQFKLLKAEKQKLDSLLTIENKALVTALQSLVDLFKKKLDRSKNNEGGQYGFSDEEVTEIASILMKTSRIIRKQVGRSGQAE